MNVRYLLIGCLLLALSGCASNNTSYRYEKGHHIVKAGETLYGISWNYGLDYKTVARWNGIRAPYRIYPGQRILVSRDYAPRSTTTTPRRSAATTGTKKTTTAAAKKTIPAPATPARNTASAVRPGDWQWPVKGRILTRFSGSDSKGIDIVATEGTSIRAASAGRVVYSGSGLRGYGNLIIIKHNDTYLSAYGHNRKLLVSEGASVKAGQVIAELGTSGTDRPKLHFEIRRNGQPVDPLGYLPKL